MVVNLGRGNMRRVHRLVLEAFVGPAPAGTEGCHNDGNPQNNALSNLRWDTHAENMLDQVRHGTKAAPPTFRGETHPMTKLTAGDVLFIRAQPQRRGLLAEMSRRFGVSDITIKRIRDRQVWTHI